MSGRRLLSADALSTRLAELGPQRPVPLLVLRLVDLEHVAWREGIAAACRIERRARDAFTTRVAARLREGDLLAHDRRSELFAIALTAAARMGDSAPLPKHCRTALERASRVFAATNVRIQTGWAFAERSPAFEEQLRDALERGERERRHADVLSPVAHEMRTPLTAIRGFLETVLDETLDAPTSRRFLEIARSETLRLARLIDGVAAVSLLDVAYGERNESAPLEPAFAHACEVVRLRACEREVRIEGAAIPHAAVAMSFDHLVQVIVNVLSNAIEHGAQGGRVAVSAEVRERVVEMCFDDDGPGIAVAERRAVFEPGYRTSNAGRGSGLGLSVVRRLVERAGGNVWAARSQLCGARILIRIPVLTG